jgi:tRNA(adenine34) deaminase
MATHEDWMRLALAEAHEAFKEDEVPVGAVIARGDELICAAHNRREAIQSPLSHAELDVIAEASRRLHSWRLEDCTLYVTLEPCLMCIGAAIQARIKTLVFGCRDPKAGAVRSLYQCAEDERLNHRIEVVEGVLGDEAGLLLTSFFRQLRERGKTG